MGIPNRSTKALPFTTCPSLSPRPLFIYRVIHKIQKIQGEYLMFIENIGRNEKHKAKKLQRKITWSKLWKCTNFGAIFSFALCFFDMCTPRRKEHALRFVVDVEGRTNFNAKKLVVSEHQKVFRLLENNQLGFSSLFKLVFLICMNAIKVCLKGEVQCLKVGALIEKRSHVWKSFGELANTLTKNTLIGKFRGALIEHRVLEKILIVKLASAST